ncbi:MAG: hypothetical protein H7138_05940 [Myxococcales bacterium]|nr:hypothetical protein [Myxococcales bacterium]
MRRLAHALVKDAATADDVAQDAWLATAGKTPAHDQVRPWLSRVVRNVVRMRARSTRRRAGYEAAIDVGESVPRSDDVVARMEAHQLLAAEVLALDEPYRSTIVSLTREVDSFSAPARGAAPYLAIAQRILERIRDTRAAKAASTARQGQLTFLVLLVLLGKRASEIDGEAAPHVRRFAKLMGS